MDEIEPIGPTGSEVAVRQDQAKLPFGFLAYFGAAASVLVCYAQVLVGLIAPVLGVAVLPVDPHLQAILMWVFGLLVVIGLGMDRRKHGRNLPFVTGAVGLAVIVGTLYLYYQILILVLGYILLVVAAFLNQNIMLGRLNRNVRAQARQLTELNSTLEQRVDQQVAEIDRLARLRRFLAPEIADLITTEGTESLLNSHRRYIACLFCDIREFTALSESIEPEEMMNILQAFHERLGKLIAERGGTIGYRAGDGLMVFFNDPLPCDAPVLDAVRLALGMRSAFDEMRQGWERLGHSLGLGIGIASGYATLGVVGYEGRIDYTALGNAVNVASRLCDAAEDGQILINHRAYVDVDGQVEAETAGPFELKGIGKKIEAYNIRRLAGPVHALQA